MRDEGEIEASVVLMEDLIAESEQKGKEISK